MTGAAEDKQDAAEEELHAADCPMTNAREEARTVCTCESIHQLGISDERDTPVGGGG